jgi:hypothetical protein
MWWIGATALVFGLLGAALELLQGNNNGDIDPVCPWDADPPPDIDNPFDFTDFGPWKGRKEDEWIIGGVLLFIILKTKFWK